MVNLRKNFDSAHSKAFPMPGFDMSAIFDELENLDKYFRAK